MAVVIYDIKHKQKTIQPIIMYGAKSERKEYMLYKQMINNQQRTCLIPCLMKLKVMRMRHSLFMIIILVIIVHPSDWCR